MRGDGVPSWRRPRSGHIITVALVIGLLYVGRAVLIPLTLAVMLSLLVAPLVRALRRIRVGRTSSVLIAVLTLTLACIAVTVVLGTQTLRIAASLPQYQTNVQRKIRTLDTVMVGRLRLLTSEANRLVGVRDLSETGSASDAKHGGASAIRAADDTSVPAPEVASRPLKLMGKIAASLWRPLQATGIVILVLIFVLLEYESLRDRIIRIVGATDIRATTAALNDAGERLSRFFVSQFAVNLAFAVAIGIILGLLRVPQAMLCATLAGLLRFVPYVGVGIAALIATALAFAVDPGWSLALSALGAFIVLDLIAGQVLEPRLYGHATGLSPLSVVVAAIFWSALWGPVGLILSTPLTVCLLVAGHHVKGLSVLELLLGDVQPLALPENFYQRALSGDSHELIANARTFLKRHPLATYCDRVLLPALHLAYLDSTLVAATGSQAAKIRRVVAEVLIAVGGERLKIPRRLPGGSVLQEVSAARWLRQQREHVSGRWQGPLGVRPGSVVICMGLGSSADDLAAELLARIFRAQAIDARQFSPGEIGIGLPSGADPEGVAMVYLLSAFPCAERSRAEPLIREVHKLLPHAHVVKVFCPGVATSSISGDGAGTGDPTVTTLTQAIEFCAASQEVMRTGGLSHGVGFAAPIGGV